MGSFNVIKIFQKIGPIWSESHFSNSYSRRTFLKIIGLGITGNVLLGQGYSSAAVKDPILNKIEWEDCLAPQKGKKVRDSKKKLDKVDENENRLFLTFDDGPLPCTAKILDLLALKAPKATFFIIGQNLENTKLRKFAIRALQEGHDIGNHSYTHPDFSTISAKKAAQEIISTHKIIQEIVEESGVDPKKQNLFFRFPFGIVGSTAQYIKCNQVLAELNYKIAWWDLDTKDWCMEIASRAPSQVIASLNHVKPHDIVLLHDRFKTAEYLPEMLHVLESRKLVSIPLSDIEVGQQKLSEQKNDLAPEAFGHLDPQQHKELINQILQELRP